MSNRAKLHAELANLRALLDDADQNTELRVESVTNSWKYHLGRELVKLRDLYKAKRQRTAVRMRRLRAQAKAAK